MHEITLKITQEPCPIPSTIYPLLPAGFNPIVLKCLEKDPDKRFQSGGELAQVLAAVVRSLPPYEPEVSKTTQVGHLNLDTKVAAAAARASRLADESDSPIAATVVQQPKELRRPTLWERLPIPAVALQEINPGWFWSIILAALGLAIAPIVLVNALRDQGPWPAPSNGAMLNRYETLRGFRAAQNALEDNKLIDAEARCLKALHQAPSSRAGRRLMAEINRALNDEKTILASRETVEGLVQEGRDQYRRGRYGTAISSFKQALEIDPAHELATSYLELAQDRQSDAARRSGPRPQRTASTSTGVRLRATPKAEEPVSGLARIMLVFNSPLNAGVFDVTIDGQLLTEVPFDFTRKGFLGVKRKGSGTVKRALVAPSGRHALEITLRSSELSGPASASFSEVLPAGSEWNLRVDLPTAESRPSFYLVKTEKATP